MKVVYIAHPIGGDVQNNIVKILAIVKEINLTMPDVVPFVPYLADVMALDDNLPEHRARGIKNNSHWFEKRLIDELWVYGDSPGVRAEIQMAVDYDISTIWKIR